MCQGESSPWQWFSTSLFCFLMAFGAPSYLPDTTIEIGVLALFGSLAILFAHLREMVGAIFRHIGRATFLSDGAIVLSATLLFKSGATLFPDTSIVVLSIFVADRAPPSTARLRC